jgi:ribosomal protein S18 acetylase RimI-like enzyme
MTFLRRSVPEDAAAVRALVRAAYAKWVPVVGREPKPMTADYEAAIRDHQVDLLCQDGQIIALIELVPEPGCLLIENVAVSPGHAGNGHGRFLMGHALDVARSLGRGRVRLYTNKLMAENIALYRRLGYAIDSERTTPDGRQTVHMSLAL